MKTDRQLRKMLLRYFRNVEKDYLNLPFEKPLYLVNTIKELEDSLTPVKGPVKSYTTPQGITHRTTQGKPW